MTPQPWDADHEFTPAQAREAIRAAFPELVAEEVRFLAEGWDFRVFEVDGERVFRFPKRAGEERRLAAEIAFLARIADALPVPVPRYEHVAEGCAGYRKLPGRPVSAIDDSTGCAAEFASFLTALHGLPAAGLGLPVRGEESGPPRRHARLAQDLAPVEARLEPRVRAACRAVVESEPPPPLRRPGVVTHDDLFPEHVLVSADGTRVTGVLDWGDAAVCDPAVDFFLAGFCGGEAMLRDVLAHYRGEVDGGLFARALDGARCMAVMHVVDGVRMERPDYLAEGLVSLDRL